MRTKALVTLLVFLTVGCDDGCTPHDNGFIWYGETVTVHGDGRRESDACGGSLEALDTHTRDVVEFLGVDEPPRYQYWWLAEEVWDQLKPCPPGASACGNEDGIALSRELPDMHEAVHMVTHSIGDDGCPSILDEGLAVYLDDASFRERLPSEEYRVEEMLEEHPIVTSGASYARAGHFVSFLVYWYGAEAVRELCEMLPRESTRADWEAATGAVLGASVDELLSNYADYPVCSSQQLRARFWGCAGAPDFTFVPNDEDAKTFVVESGCSDERATNASRSGNAILSRLVYFPVDTWVELSATSIDDSGVDATVMSQECVTCEQDPQIIREGDALPNWYRYRAGLHEVTVFFDKQHLIRLTMRRMP